MKVSTKLLGLAGIVGAAAVTAIVIDRHRRQLVGRGAGAPSDLAVSPVVGYDAEIVGISEVDPQFLSGMGEAVNPERVARAHEEIPAQRAKLRKS